MEIRVSSGIITAIYFVFLELGMERFIFYLTAQLQAYELLRTVNHGKLVSTRPSKIPVLGEALRHRCSWVTFCVLLLRLILIAAIFCLNFGTEGASMPASRRVSRAYIAYQNAVDAEWFKNGTYTFNRDFNALSGCARETEDGLDYFDLAMDLLSGERGLSDLDESSKVPAASRRVDFARMICLDGINYSPRKLAMRIEGCGQRAAECKSRPLNPDWNELEWKVNNLSRAFVQRRVIEGAWVIGLQAVKQMAECVYASDFANCAVWNSSAASKMMKIMTVDLRDLLRLHSAQNRSTVRLRMLEDSGTAVISGGAFGRISVAHAMADSTARHPPDILAVINRIFSRSVEYRPNEEELFALSGSQAVTQIDDLALGAAVVLAVISVVACVWVLTERFCSGSGGGQWWKFTSDGLLTVWSDDVAATCAKDQYPTVYQVHSEQGITRVAALKAEEMQPFSSS